ncbi:hypothetical protein [Hyalangium minutum]|uniref:Carotenogenesis protein carR n=1 Tax=Hyalangium minutum TaxID=394096 RepID=A0A085W930_9BACT|nr:hypothetical protein [Hyalangium minutum]KFE64193.1 Carotenogenesis protein carR [Hyalangium minutum]
MRPTLDNLLTQAYPADAASFGKALEAARQELARNQAVRRWRTQALWVFISTVAMVVLMASVLLVLEQMTLGMLLSKAPLFVLLWVTGAVCAWGALSPRGERLRAAGIVLSAVSAAALVLARGESHVEATLPGWVCSASHVAVGLGPLIVAVLALRSASFRPMRALVAGLSVGTTGALVGELACSQGRMHVMGYHLTAWAVIAGVEWAVSRTLKSRSFAP